MQLIHKYKNMKVLLLDYLEERKEVYHYRSQKKAVFLAFA